MWSGKSNCLISTSELESQLNREKEERRKARIIQVRLQSKGIADKIRRACEQEKEYQLNLLTESSKKSKILEIDSKLEILQKHYSTCLEHIGEGHDSVAIQERLLTLQKDRGAINGEIAAVRGKAANIEMHRAQQRANVEIQTRNVNRQENAIKEKIRAAAIAALPRPPMDALDGYFSPKTTTQPLPARCKVTVQSDSLPSKRAPFTNKPVTPNVAACSQMDDKSVWVTGQIPPTTATSSHYHQEPIPLKYDNALDSNVEHLGGLRSNIAHAAVGQNKRRRKLRVSVGYKSQKKRVNGGKMSNNNGSSKVVRERIHSSLQGYGGLSQVAHTKNCLPSAIVSRGDSGELIHACSLAEQMTVQQAKLKEKAEKNKIEDAKKSQFRFQSAMDKVRQERTRTEVMNSLEKLELAERQRKIKELGKETQSGLSGNENLQLHLEHLVETMCTRNDDVQKKESPICKINEASPPTRESEGDSCNSLNVCHIEGDSDVSDAGLALVNNIKSAPQTLVTAPSEIIDQPTTTGKLHVDQNCDFLINSPEEVSFAVPETNTTPAYMYYSPKLLPKPDFDTRMHLHHHQSTLSRSEIRWLKNSEKHKEIAKAASSQQNEKPGTKSTPLVKMKLNRRSSSFHRNVMTREMLRNFLESRGVEQSPMKKNKAFTKSYVKTPTTQVAERSVLRKVVDVPTMVEVDAQDSMELQSQPKTWADMLTATSSTSMDESYGSSLANVSTVSTHFSEQSPPASTSSSSSTPSFTAERQRFELNEARITECEEEKRQIDVEREQLQRELYEVRRQKERLDAGVESPRETSPQVGEDCEHWDANVTMRRRCPLTVMRGMDVTPHELSTIAEVVTPRSSYATVQTESVEDDDEPTNHQPPSSTPTKFFPQEPGIMEEANLTLIESDAASLGDGIESPNKTGAFKLTEMSVGYKTKSLFPTKTFAGDVVAQSSEELSPLSTMLRKVQESVFTPQRAPLAKMPESSSPKTPESPTSQNWLSEDSPSESLLSFQRHELSSYSSVGDTGEVSISISPEPQQDVRKSFPPSPNQLDIVSILEKWKEKRRKSK